MATLDNDFGLALPPDRNVSPAEKRYSPSSLQKLDSSSGARLKALMDEVSNGITFPKITFWSISILWIMDEFGEIYFSVEEIVNSKGGFVALLQQDNVVPPGKSKLGHPSLISGANARIAGEIYFDLRANSPAWTISNCSGRYGLRKTTQKKHLENVSKIFSKHGISMDIFYIG